ncbi:MAG: hypothetical protein ACAF42_07140 [Limnothrix sp. BL-A-16]
MLNEPAQQTTQTSFRSFAIDQSPNRQIPDHGYSDIGRPAQTGRFPGFTHHQTIARQSPDNGWAIARQRLGDRP